MAKKSSGGKKGRKTTPKKVKRGNHSLIKEGMNPIDLSPERRVGYAFKKKKDPLVEPEEFKSFAAPSNDDGSIVVDASGFYGTYIDLDGIVRSEFELLTKYRDLALQHECADAIEHIVNQSIVMDEEEPPTSIDLDNAKSIPPKIKKIISEEFDNILKLLDYNNQASDIFRQWYVDGRLYYHKMIDEKHTDDGIQELRYIDPRQIRKVREIKRGRDKETGVETIDIVDEYFVYNARGVIGQTYSMANHGIKILKDSICYVHSGICEPKTRMILSCLHKAIKPYNQLRMMEDATVIYKLTRSPARLIFNVDVGNLPKKQAEQYLQKVIANYKSRLVYDAADGSVKDDRHHMSMLENYFFPKREGTQGSSVTNLEGSDSFDKMEGVEYFKQQFYRSLGIPLSRLEHNPGFNLGRATEISRDELNFNKACNRLKSKFSYLFDDLLKTQLQLKGVMTEEEWEDIKGDIQYKFATDSYFSESKELEVLHSRINAVKDMGVVDNLVGTYYSKGFVRKNVLKQTDEEIAEIEKEIQDERGSEAKDAVTDMKYQSEVDKQGAHIDFETNKYMEKHGLIPEPELDEDGKPIEEEQ